MSTEERKTVSIACRHANGLKLQLYKPHHHENGADCKIPDPDQEAVTLAGGDNVVDREFMLAWIEENHGGGDLVDNGTITVPEDLLKEARKVKKPDEDETNPARARQ